MGGLTTCYTRENFYFVRNNTLLSNVECWTHFVRWLLSCKILNYSTELQHQEDRQTHSLLQEGEEVVTTINQESTSNTPERVVNSKTDTDYLNTVPYYRIFEKLLIKIPEIFEFAKIFIRGIISIKQVTLRAKKQKINSFLCVSLQQLYVLVLRLNHLCRPSSNRTPTCTIF